MSVPNHAHTPARLDDCADRRELVVPEDPGVEPAYLDLPATPGVAVFLARAGETSNPPSTLLIATTANLRELARRRLAIDADSAGRVAYRHITSMILALPAGSALEADAMYLREARERMPLVYRAVSERWRCWFAHVDPDAEFPQWSKTNLLVGLVGKRSASTLISGEGASGSGGVPPGVLLGPLPDKDAAGRFIERVIDAFDLCRYHHLLVQAPSAKACAYKEMGRCPGPCDGSESMPDYRSRTYAALDLVTRTGLSPGIEALEAEMHSAALNGEFERASVLKAQAERLRSLQAPSFVHVRDLACWRALVLLRSPTPGCVRPAIFDRGGLYRLGDVSCRDADAITAGAATLLMRVRACVAGERFRQPLTLDTDCIDTIGLFSRWLFQPAKRRTGEVLSIDTAQPDLGLSEPTIAKAIKKLFAPKKTPDEPVSEQELEAGAMTSGGGGQAGG